MNSKRRLSSIVLPAFAAAMLVAAIYSIVLIDNTPALLAFFNVVIGVHANLFKFI